MERTIKYYPFYVTVGLLFFGLLFFNSVFFKGSKKYLGVTVAKEHKISCDRPSTVKKVHVFSGQTVNAGELLVELISNELNLDIEKINNQINALKSEVEVRSKLVDSEIEHLRAQKGIKQEELEVELTLIYEESELNKKMIEELNPQTSRLDAKGVDLEQVKIASLKEQQALHAKATAIKIQDIRQKHKVEQELLKSKMAMLTNERQLLEAETKKLNKYTSAPGVIENVYVKEGEEIRSFAQLVSINPRVPTSVTAYIVGKNQQETRIGQEVTVSSFNRRHLSTKGKIIGFGAMTALPNILQKSTAVTAYGKEIFIQIEASKDFVTGEKVVID